jgi:hypothetical protein
MTYLTPAPLNDSFISSGEEITETTRRSIANATEHPPSVGVVTGGSAVTHDLGPLGETRE